MADSQQSQPMNRRIYESSVFGPRLKQMVTSWLEEDCHSFDIGGAVVGDKPEKAVLLAKSDLVLAGKPFFNEVFEQLGCAVEWLVEEGESQKPIKQMAIVTGKVRNILQGERTALNAITRCTSIATRAHQFTQLAKKHGWKGEIAGTRKTTPGFRMVEKYGLMVGGASTHRYDLSHMCMLKDNHIDSAGSITRAVQAARQLCGFSQKIEVECRSEADAFEACKAGADIVMLDNFDPARASEVSTRVKAAFPHVILEVSGGITLSNIESFFLPNVDVISIGSLTQGVPSVDISLKIMKQQ
eukprot:GEZU01008481.1.p1 GENE.GEZU01008481.1~~GEZU01008481.1.p1  ORF type:complete len:299 (-),score=62.07 GEZU01008481.1:167-1063(-)